MTRQVPPEIWYRVIYYLPIMEQKPLLQVSKMFHDIAVTFVFSSLKIYLVDCDSESMLLGTDENDIVEEAVQTLMRRSWELLFHIIRNPQFAKLVRSLTVITSTISEGIFEELTLLEALLSLSNLQTFRWFGINPSITKSIVNRIPKCVKTLDLNSTLPSGTTFTHLDQLVRLDLPVLKSYPVRDMEFYGAVEESLLEHSKNLDVEEIFKQLIRKPLQELTMLAFHMSRVPFWIYRSLTSLEVCSTSDGPDLSGLGLALRHTAALESLTVSGVGGPDLSFLPKTPLELPHLHSFRLTRECVPATVGELYSQPLRVFLQDRHQLRRLYIRIESATSDDLSTLLRVICGLCQLEVFGLHIGFSSFSDTEISEIAGHLPVNLKALQLLLSWNVTLISMNSLVSALEIFPRLSFLHLSSGEDGTLSLMAKDLAYDLKQLDLFGLNHSLWNIRRSGEEPSLHRWPRWKTRFCVENDFDDEDDAWLYRYHQGRPS